MRARINALRHFVSGRNKFSTKENSVVDLATLEASLPSSSTLSVNSTLRNMVFQSSIPLLMSGEGAQVESIEKNSAPHFIVDGRSQEIAAAPGFGVWFNDVTRDKSQGGFANLMPLDDPLALQIFTSWNQLNKLGPAIFGAIENGGADPQVTENKRRKNFLETAFHMRQAGLETVLRSLFRGANGWVLLPSHKDDLYWLLKTLAERVAPLGAKQDELLRIKVFDSQAIIAEVESTVSMVADLRKQGHPISVEIAIPYSADEDENGFNPYPDEFFVNRILEVAKLGEKYGLPSRSVRLSLKDMIGKLKVGTAGKLMRAIIQGLRNQGVTTEIGLHLHDTGFALDAYVEAIKVCYEEGWPINVDTVGGEKSGFVNTLELINAVEAMGIKTDISILQVKKLEEIDALQNELSAKYEAARVESAFSDDDLRYFHIPGGGESSFINAVTAGRYAGRLGLSHEHTLHVVATALRVMRKLMGNAFPVTPGFQNIQLAALNFVDNLIKAGRFTIGDYKAIKAVILTALTDEEVEQLFLKNLNFVVKEFLKGEMPTEIHPVIRRILGRRNGLLTDGQKSNLPAAMEVVRELQVEKVIENTEQEFNIAVARALIVGPHQFPSMARHPHLGREVCPIGLTKQEWIAIKERTQVIRSAGVPDPYAERGARTERFFGQSTPASWIALAPPEVRRKKFKM